MFVCVFVACELRGNVACELRGQLNAIMKFATKYYILKLTRYFLCSMFYGLYRERSYLRKELDSVFRAS